MQIKVNRVGNFTATQKLRLEQAESILNSILESIDFKLKVASLDPLKYFSGTVTKPKELAEIFGEASKGSVKVVNVSVWRLPWYKKFTSAIAYESNNQVHLRSTYLESGKLQDLSATILHEVMHVFGYGHDFWATKKRPFSVPYAIGQIISEWHL